MHRCMPETPTVPNDLPWGDLRVLLAVLRDGSFTAAAKSLGVEQSTVSRRVAALEQALGVALFERTRRAPVPTEAALRLRDAASRVESEFTRFCDEAQGLQSPSVSGRVRVATTDEVAAHVIVPRVLPALRARFPDLCVDLVTGYAAADLVGREADIAVRFFQTARGDLVGRRVARLPTVVLGSRRKAKSLRRTQLEALPWISVELAGLSTPESQWLAARVPRPPIMVCSSYQVQLAAIRAGLGVGVGPRVYADFERDFIALDDPAGALPTLDVYVVARRAIRALPRVAAVFEALSECFAELGQ
jgi:DNA-binding transcriptional LysR family regulator